MQQLKPHRTTLTTSKRAYTCAHCRDLGHTKPKCPILLSGNQSIQPAKSIDPGDYVVYLHPIISDQRNNSYRLCDLRELPRELHPDSSTTQSRSEYSLFQSITENEMEEENTKRISLKFPPPGTTKSCIISRNKQLLTVRKPSEIKDTNYEKTDEEYTTNVQEQIELGANCIVTNVRRDTAFHILKQQYEQKMGTKMGTKMENIQKLYPDVHLNSAALSQENQSTVRAPTIPIIDSNFFFSELKVISKSSHSSDRARVCILQKGCKPLIDFLVTYLKYNPELKGPLPLFRLPGKTLLLTEEQQIISYQNIPDACGLTLESLQSMIDGDGVEVSWILMENYYGLLREKFQSDDSSVTIPNLHSI